jgi:cytochrome c peroxidase
MKQPKLIALAAACIPVAISLSIPSHIVHGQNTGSDPFPGPFYNPYPPGILPFDIASEEARIQREVDGIEQQAIQEWKALGPPNLVGNPPILEGNGYQLVNVLGKLLNYDVHMSPLQDRACASCHMPYAGFSGPIPSVNLTMIAYPGSFPYVANKRTAIRYTYAPFNPVENYNTEQGLFFGGNFWDGRATGYKLQSPDSEQAQWPPLDPGEMQFPDPACIAFRLETSQYKSLFEEVWGDALDINFPWNTEQICATPAGAAIFGSNTRPINLSPQDRNKALSVYDHWGQSISKYQASPAVSAFSSKFDAYLKGNYTLTADEAAGYQLFNGKGNCNSCHVDGRSTLCVDQKYGCAPSSSSLTDTGTTASVTPKFTCFGFANEGLPLNPRISYFYETKPDKYGFTPNPYGFGYRDLGQGNFFRSGFGSGPNPNASWISNAPTSDGQFAVMTARDAALTPPQCPTTEAPGPYFQKEFFHNGYIKSLKQLVHFYNTRDVYPFNVTSGHCPAGTTEKVNCWPMPEVPNNIDMTTGNLQLTDEEENQIVAFLETLADGYTTPYPNVNTFTGQCSYGGTAATQGNAYLIPTPPLPPCAPEICDVAPLPAPNPIP